MQKALNLYAGIGGNRKEWSNVDVTAVEKDEEIAQVYSDHFPDDEVIIGDAHAYLEEHYNEFDFIWTSPPCPTHSQIRKAGSGEGEQNDPVYPDMTLYEEILFLDGYFNGDWVVENVNPWYNPLIEAKEAGRHYFWSNLPIVNIDMPHQNNQYGSIEEWQDLYGFDLSEYDIPHNKKKKMLRNCVHPTLGKHIIDLRTTQSTL